MTRQSNSWEEKTRPDLLRPSMQQKVEAAHTEDEDSVLGKVMRQTADNTAALNGLRTDFDVLAREVRQSQRAAPATIDSSAKQASNRMAALMTALFTIYEVTSPWVRELTRQVTHR
ncbi:MAG: hypothetical protein KGI75_19990 [Rhizobiaceae bacterium]|nr:hypothetical protein [Rhizobiaceae bacterium]